MIAAIAIIATVNLLLLAAWSSTVVRLDRLEARVGELEQRISEQEQRADQ